jgi:hypothetical protein
MALGFPELSILLIASGYWIFVVILVIHVCRSNQTLFIKIA